MEQQKFIRCPKYTYQKLPFQIKLEIVRKVTNGQISVNHAAKEYGISRSSIDYWIKKLATFNQKSIGMSKDQEIKKLKEKIQELEFVKDFQQDIIADFENITGEHLSKKYLPEALAKEIEKKRLNLSKESGSINASE